MTVRAADPAHDLEAIERLWLAYLGWGNDELEARYGFRLAVEEAVERDLASLAKFQPPDGALLVAGEAGDLVGTASMQRIGPGAAEIKRMYVDPSAAASGTGGSCSTTSSEWQGAQVMSASGSTARIS